MAFGWLKKAGSIALKGIELAAGNAPTVKVLVPKAAGAIDAVVGDLAQIKDIIVTVEAIGQAWGQPGAEKLRVAGPLVAQAIAQSSMMAGHQIADKAAYDKACATIAGGMADLLNSLKAEDVAQAA